MAAAEGPAELSPAELAAAATVATPGELVAACSPGGALTSIGVSPVASGLAEPVLVPKISVSFPGPERFVGGGLIGEDGGLKSLRDSAGMTGGVPDALELVWVFFCSHSSGVVGILELATPVPPDPLASELSCLSGVP